MSHASFARKPAPDLASKAPSGGLRIGAPDDAFEREADRVAAEVVTCGTEFKPPRSLSRISIGAPLQRKCTCGGSASPGEDCETCREQKATLQRKSAGSTYVAEIPPQVDSALAALGRPLDPATRSSFEPRFGHDFSRVRVHVDDAATDSVSAHAFTVGERIVFAANQYQPTTKAGRRLLAHELTHVVQQSNPGSSGATDALEAEAHSVGARASAGQVVSIGGATPRGALQREEAVGGQVRVIAKENGKVAVVLVQEGKVVKGYAEIQPPRGISAAAAALITFHVTPTIPRKVVVVVPPGWGRQATNPAAAVKVMDTKALDRETAEAQRKAKLDEQRDLYRQYLNDTNFQFDYFGQVLPGAGSAVGSPADTKSDDEIVALAADNSFFEWKQRRKRQNDWQRFQNEGRAMGYDDPEGIKEMWKQYDKPDLEMQQEGEKQLHELRYDPEHALQENYATPLLLNWIASNPQPVEAPGNDGPVKRYELKLPDGSVATLDATQYAKLRQIAKDKMETELNTVQNRINLYQSHKNDRGLISKGMDSIYGANIEGNTWSGTVNSVQAGRDALAHGDLKESLASIEDAERQGAVARKEWNRYVHYREVGGEITIQGLEYVKTASEVTLAVGTIPLGGAGLVIVTGKGVTENVACLRPSSKLAASTSTGAMWALTSESRSSLRWPCTDSGNCRHWARTAQSCTRSAKAAEGRWPPTLCSRFSSIRQRTPPSGPTSSARGRR